MPTGTSYADPKYLLASSGHGCREVLGGEDGDGSAASTATARRRGLRRPGGEDGGGSAASPCVRSTKTESVSEHLWNFKTLLHNSVIYRSNFIQTPAIWLKFSDPNPGHMAEVL